MKTYRNVRIITLMTLLSRIFGAARDLVIAHVFGAGFASDAFLQAFAIPNLFRRLTAEGSMTLAFIPIYTDVRSQGGHAKLFARRVLAVVLIVSGLIVSLGIIFSPQLVKMIAWGFDDQSSKFQLTVELTQVMFPFLILTSITAWAGGVLNAEKRFAEPAAAPILLNFGMLFGAFAIAPFLETPIFALAWGVLLGGLLQILLQLFPLWQVKQSIIPKNPFHDQNVGKLLKLFAPSLFSVAAYQINIIILRTLASFLPEGQLTHYYNANRLTELALGVFAFALTTANFPDLSQQSSNQDWQQARETLHQTFSSMLFIIMPATAGLFAFAQPIVAMLYLHGKYHWLDVESTALALHAFALGIPAVAGVRLLVSAFYAVKDSKTPVMVACLGIVITAGSGWILSQHYQVLGLSIALSLGGWGQYVVLQILLLRNSVWKSSRLPFLKIGLYLICSAVMGLFAYQMSKFGNWEQGAFSLQNWIVFLGVLSGSAMLYWLLTLICKDQHAQAILLFLKRLMV